MVTPDLRNHGRTWNAGQGFKAPHNLAAAARKIPAWHLPQCKATFPCRCISNLKRLFAGDLDTVSHAGQSRWRMLIGHSLGGKVVLQYLKHLMGASSTVVQGLPEQVCSAVVLDLNGFHPECTALRDQEHAAA